MSDGYHGQYLDQSHDHVYGNNGGGHYENNYGTYYDPNMSNSVFEESGDQYGGGHGMMTPLPGTLGSVSHTPLPREAPRAVFDEDNEQEPGQGVSHPGHPLFANRHKASSVSVGSEHQPGLLLFSYFLVSFLSFSFP